MCLFHLIKQHHAVGTAANRFGKLSSFLIPHISGRRADEPGDRILFHIFRHIDTNQILFIVKQAFCQGFCQFRLAYAGGAKEHKAADGTIRILNPRTGAHNGLRHRLHRLILTNDTAMEGIFQMQQLLLLPLHQTADRYAGPALNDSGNLIICDLIPKQGIVLLILNCLLFRRSQGFLCLRQLAVFQFRSMLQIIILLRFFNVPMQLFDLFTELLHPKDLVFLIFPLGLHNLEGVPFLSQFLLQLLKPTFGQGITFLFQSRFFDLHLNDLPAYPIQLRGHGIHFRADHGAGLVNEIDGLVRQESVGDIAVAESGRGNNGGICDLNAVEYLIALLQASKNGHGVFHSGLCHKNRLETALQRGILFNILAVFIQRGSTDAVKLSPRQHGF